MEHKKEVMEHDMNDFNRLIVDGIEKCNSLPSEGMMFNLMNTRHTRTLIELIKVGLNRNGYKIRVRGSQSDRKKYRDAGINLGTQSTPLKYSDRLRVYIEPLKGWSDSNSAAYTSLLERNRQLVLEASELAAELDEALTALRNVRDESVGRLDIISEQDNEIKRLKSELSIKYAGASDDDKKLLKNWEDAPILLVFKELWKLHGSKLYVVKHFKDYSKLGLRDAKTICDYLICL